MTAELPLGVNPEIGAFKPQSDFSPTDLPTVMRKAFDLSCDDVTPHMTNSGSLI